MLDNEISDILEKLDAELTTLEIKCTFFKTFEKPHNFEKERKLRLSAKEKINEIERLNEEVKNKDDDAETKFSKLLTDLEYDKHDTLHDITILESKVIKLGTIPIQIDKIKESVLSS